MTMTIDDVRYYEELSKRRDSIEEELMVALQETERLRRDRLAVHNEIGRLIGAPEVQK